MAGIDKIYGTQEQYFELEKWLVENQKPIKVLVGRCGKEGDQYEDLLPTDCLYEKEGYNKEHRPISNFGIEIDGWLQENCPLDFVQKRLKEQYGKT